MSGARCDGLIGRPHPGREHQPVVLPVDRIGAQLILPAAVPGQPDQDAGERQWLRNAATRRVTTYGTTCSS
jgi:hypothetical protein